MSEPADPARPALPLTRLSLGTGSIAGLYRPVSERQAEEALEAAWEAGVRYFDTAPHYGQGLAEARLGAFLRGKPRGEYVVSSKVGRLLRADQPLHPTQLDADGQPFFKGAPPLGEVYDYSHDGCLRSLEESLGRLGLDRVDILYIHDPDAVNCPVREVMAGAYRALLELREQGVVGAIGVGMNDADWLAEFARAGDFDLFLSAGRYTLLDQAALRSLLPVCAQKGVGVVVAGAYNSGILADPRPGTTYDYGPAGQALIERALRIQKVCRDHRVSLKAAAMQFPLGHPSVVSVLSGARSKQEVDENARMLQAPIPGGLWDDLKAQGLLTPDTPTPKGAQDGS